MNSAKLNKNLTQEELATLYLLAKMYLDPETNLEGYWGEDYEEFSPTDEFIKKKDLKRIVGKLKSSITKNILEEMERKFLFVKYGNWNREADEGVIRKINRAIENSRRIEIEYFSPDSKKTTKREVDIYAKNYRYIVGFCHLRND